MSRRPLAGLRPSFAFALVLVACGEDAGSARSAPAAPAPTAAPTPAPADPDFAAYRETVASGVGFDLVPIAGGTFTMGSPAAEPNRRDDEGPQVEVQLEPFWMGRCEVTWAEYDLFTGDEQLPQSKQPDGMSRPTPAYQDLTFQMGRDGYPAICMSHYAARQYCKWLSAKTGRFYRLPTEAEWEYACRAGTTTPYSCPEDQLDAAAWYGSNSARVLEPGSKPLPAYHEVGKKQPNAWGLCDLHGNVAEWVADLWLADAYATARGTPPRSNPYFAPGRDDKGRPVRYAHVTRGGSWRDGKAALRAAARQPSKPEWNARDPQLPKSWWYMTEGQHLGFRVVRPKKEPTADERARFENP